jgi:hypothetical protein
MHGGCDGNGIPETPMGGAQCVLTAAALDQARQRAEAALKATIDYDQLYAAIGPLRAHPRGGRSDLRVRPAGGRHRLE